MGGDGCTGRDGWNFNGDRGSVNAELVAQLAVDAGEDFLVLFQVGAHILAALPDALTLEAVPCATLVDDAVDDGEIERIALAGDSLP